MMARDTLQRWYRDHRRTYVELAEECRSVAELMLKIEVYGKKWTKWDWVMFMWHLSMSASCLDEEGPSAPGQAGFDTSDQAPDLFADMVDEVDNGKMLDGVLTNKTVVAHLIWWIDDGRLNPLRVGALRLLAHVFKKFPAMWTMNWMFVRHPGKNKPRTHRMEFAMFDLSGRGRRYFESRAYLDDFVYRYWGPHG